MNQLPVVLTFTSHDPSGISALQCDIETLGSLGIHCTSALTGVFAKDSREVKWQHTVPASTLVAQARAVLEDMPVCVIKIGDLNSIENIEAVHSILMDYPHIPVVFDPTSVDDQEDLATAYTSLILPMTTIAILNPSELKSIVPFAENAEMAINLVLESECEYVLTNQFTKSDKTIHNQLHSNSGCLKDFTTVRLDQEFQGAGGVLSAAIAGYMAHGAEICEAVGDSHRLLQRSLKKALSIGMGSQFPYRLAGIAS